MVSSVGSVSGVPATPAGGMSKAQFELAYQLAFECNPTTNGGDFPVPTSSVAQATVQNAKVHVNPHNPSIKLIADRDAAAAAAARTAAAAPLSVTSASTYVYVDNGAVRGGVTSTTKQVPGDFSTFSI
jgi:hypothetical protein